MIYVTEGVPIIRNWLGYEELYFVQTLTDAEQERCQTNAGLFNVLNAKFKLQHNKVILSLWYY